MDSLERRLAGEEKKVPSYMRTTGEVRVRERSRTVPSPPKRATPSPRVKSVSVADCSPASGGGDARSCASRPASPAKAVAGGGAAAAAAPAGGARGKRRGFGAVAPEWPTSGAESGDGSSRARGGSVAFGEGAARKESCRQQPGGKGGGGKGGGQGGGGKGKGGGKGGWSWH